MDAQVRRRSSQARTVVAAKPAVETLRMAKGIVINLLGHVQIRRVERMLPQLNGQHVRVDNGAGLGPRVEAIKPVIVLKVFGHAVLAIDVEAAGSLVDATPIARGVSITYQSAAGSERGMGLGADAGQIKRQELLEKGLDGLAQASVLQHGIGVNQALHADEHATNVGRQHPTARGGRNASRLGSDTLLALVGGYRVGSEKGRRVQEETVHRRANQSQHLVAALPLIIFTQGTQHPAVARELLLMGQSRMDGSHVTFFVQVGWNPSHDFIEITRLQPAGLRIEY